MKKRLNFIRCLVGFAIVGGAVLAPALVNAQARDETLIVVEYHVKSLDAYFITGRANEQQILDRTGDISRTGVTFQAINAVNANPDLTKICRFYVSRTIPFVSSHFYGRQGKDCESILAIEPPGFSYEGLDFAVQPLIPDQNAAGVVTEICPAGFSAVRRSFRPLNTSTGKTSNHRYTVSAATSARAAAAGYVSEGIQFCANFVTDVRP